MGAGLPEHGAAPVRGALHCPRPRHAPPHLLPGAAQPAPGHSSQAAPAPAPAQPAATLQAPGGPPAAARCCPGGGAASRGQLSNILLCTHAMSSKYFRNHVNCDGSSYPRDAAAQAPPSVLQREVAAPAGCRTVVTQSCRRVPRAVTRKLPEEECEQVPDTVCHTRLEKVQ